MFLILKSLQTLVCLKLAPSGNTLIFGPIPFAPPTLSLTLLLKATEFLFFYLPENFAVPNICLGFKFKDFVFEAISELIERGCVKEVLNPPKFIKPLHVVH